MRTIALVAVIAGSLASPAHRSELQEQRGVAPAATLHDFSKMPAAERSRVLNALAITSSVLSEESTTIIASAFVDPDASVRERALWTATRRASSPTNLTVWSLEREAHRRFRPAVAQLLNDRQSRVRLAALSAICALEMDLSAPHGSALRLSLESAELLARQLAVDDSDIVQAQILVAFGTHSVPASFEVRRDSLVSNSLEDPSAAVVQAAVIAVMNLKRPVHLPLAARLLTHKSPEVRTMTAQAISSFGSAAQRYIPDLRQAVAVETDEITRKTLEGAIQKISKSK